MASIRASAVLLAVVVTETGVDSRRVAAHVLLLLATCRVEGAFLACASRDQLKAKIDGKCHKNVATRRGGRSNIRCFRIMNYECAAIGHRASVEVAMADGGGGARGRAANSTTSS